MVSSQRSPALPAPSIVKDPMNHYAGIDVSLEALPPLSIFSRAAPASNADRIKPRAAASSIAARRSASSDKLALASPPIDQLRHDCKGRTFRNSRRDLGI